ncbi:MAG TPA: DUF5343 domain-containing protein [Aestuariivirga sp.]|nr:DUF5343 domain-containing protein [Aestuariivirga sp.]
MSNPEQIDGNGEHSANIPPYISFQSLKTLVSDFKQHTVPGRVDRTVLTRFSGGVGGQIVTALGFLGLIDGAKVPTSLFRSLVDSFGSEHWDKWLAKIIRESYAPLFNLNLETATPGQFAEAFRKAYPAKEQTARKCISFFLAATKEAKIPVSQYILKGTKVRAATVKRKSKAEADTATNGDQKPKTKSPQNPGSGDESPPPEKSMSDKLLEKFPPFDPAWPDEIKAKWFEGYEKLLSMGAKK